MKFIKLNDSENLSKIFIILNAFIILIHSTLDIFRIENPLYICFPIAIFAILILVLAFLIKIYETMTTNGDKFSLFLTLLLSTFIIIFGFITVSLPDFSWDGQAYHLPSIISLTNGWNAYWSPPNELMWTDVYPRGYWVLNAIYGEIFGNIEAGKIINIFFLICGLLIYSDSADNNSVNIVKKLSYFGLFLSNVISQYLTNYVDISIYMLFIIAIYIVIISKNRLINFINIVTYASLVIITMNIKISGLFFGFLMMILYLLVLWRQERSVINCLKPYGALGVSVVLIGFFLIGWQPFVTNVKTYGALSGPDPRVTLFTTAPSNLRDDNRLDNIAYSLFGAYRNTEPGEMAQLKLPFLVDTSEFHTNPNDPRSGGHGPLFGSILLLALALRLTVGFIYRLKLNRLDAAIFIIFIACYAMPGSWWARYYPIIFALPSLLIIRALDANHIWVRSVSIGLIALLAINFIPTILQSQINITHAHFVRGKILDLKQKNVSLVIFRQDKQADIYNGTPIIWSYRLTLWGVSSRLTTNLDDCRETVLEIAATRLCKAF